MTTELSPTGLAQLIKDEYRLAEASAVSSYSHLVMVGEYLTQVKSKIEHGGFEKWVEGNLPFGIRQAQRYMRYFQHRDEIEAKASCMSLLEMSVNGALALIADERPEQNDPKEPEGVLADTPEQGLADDLQHEHEPVGVEHEPELEPEQEQAAPTPRHIERVEVIPPLAVDASGTNKNLADATPVTTDAIEVPKPKTQKEAFPECAKFPEIRGWLWKLRHELDRRERRGWRTPEQGAEVTAELRRLLAQAERIRGGTR